MPSYAEMLNAVNSDPLTLANFKDNLRARMRRQKATLANTTGLTQMNTGRRVLNATPYGPNISNIPANQVLSALESTAAGPNGRNQIDAMLRRIELTNTDHSVTYEDIHNAIRNGDWVKLSAVAGKELCLTENPYTASPKDIPISYQELIDGAKGYNDLFEFDFTKTVTKITPDGDIVTFDLTYTGYIKPDCANPVNFSMTNALCTQ